MKSVIIIPARYGSTRFAGKPLAEIAGKPMVERVYAVAAKAAEQFDDVEVFVATDDSRIVDFLESKNINYLFTDVECHTGTDRCLEAIKNLSYEPDYIINLQGDAPLTPPEFVSALLSELKNNDDVNFATVVTKLSWSALDKLREHKKTTPFSGTTAILKNNNDVIWFSKNIIPAIRKEENMRNAMGLSPVYKHFGLYGYSYQMLKDYCAIEPSYYEELEGLEQLRAIENGHNIRAVPIDYNKRELMSGVDSPEDVKRAEEIIAKYGEIT